MDRKLATIFASDVVGFSKMMGIDEVNTLKILKERRKVIDNIIDDHGGIIFGSAGDSVIAEFASPIKAAQAAVDTQLKMKTMNHGQDDSETMIFRVGMVQQPFQNKPWRPFYDHLELAKTLFCQKLAFFKRIIQNRSDNPMLF